MPWYDPESDPEILDDVWEDSEDLMGLSWLRKTAPRNRTSTYRKDSPTAILGEAGEIVAVGRIQTVLERKGLAWKVGRTGTSNSRVRQIDLGPIPADDPWVPIENSQQGDVHVVDHNGRRRVSFEVKASLSFPNATISESELRHSGAEYLIGVTRAGFWVCTMAEARKHAYPKEGPFGVFYVIPYDAVQKVQLSDIFPEL